MTPGARFTKAQETFRARKTLFISSVSINEKVHTPETSCMKEPNVHIKKMQIKQLCNRKVQDFATVFRARFRETGPWSVFLEGVRTRKAKENS